MQSRPVEVAEKIGCKANALFRLKRPVQKFLLGKVWWGCFEYRELNSSIAEAQKNPTTTAAAKIS